MQKKSNTEIVVLKCQDKKEMLCLSTKQTAEITQIRKRNTNIKKTTLIYDYNDRTLFIDLYDQPKV